MSYLLRQELSHVVMPFFPACIAETLLIGTLKGEQQEPSSRAARLSSACTRTCTKSSTRQLTFYMR
jgi:hypothetical protein